MGYYFNSYKIIYLRVVFKKYIYKFVALIFQGSYIGKTRHCRKKQLLQKIIYMKIRFEHNDIVYTINLKCTYIPVKINK